MKIAIIIITIPVHQLSHTDFTFDNSYSTHPSHNKISIRYVFKCTFKFGETNLWKNCTSIVLVYKTNSFCMTNHRLSQSTCENKCSNNVHFDIVKFSKGMWENKKPNWTEKSWLWSRFSCALRQISREEIYAITLHKGKNIKENIIYFSIFDR